MIYVMPCRKPCRLYIHLAFTYSFGPSSTLWSELGPAPPFSTNESDWSVMVTGSQSPVWSGPKTKRGSNTKYPFWCSVIGLIYDSKGFEKLCEIFPQRTWGGNFYALVVGTLQMTLGKGEFTHYYCCSSFKNFFIKEWLKKKRKFLIAHLLW